MWSIYVHGIVQLLAQMATWLDGSFGLAVVVLALLVRFALLPLTLRAAERGWRRQQQMLMLEPALQRLRERHAKDAVALAQATQALYRKHGVDAGRGAGLLVAAVQMPVGAGVYSAIRHGLAGAGSFLWIPKLARPDLWLALIVAMLSYAAIVLNPAMSTQAKALLQLLPVLFSFFMVWHLAAGLGLYWVGSSSVNLLQVALLRRRVRAA